MQITQNIFKKYILIVIPLYSFITPCIVCHNRTNWASHGCNFHLFIIFILEQEVGAVKAEPLEFYDLLCGEFCSL